MCVLLSQDLFADAELKAAREPKETAVVNLTGEVDMHDKPVPITSEQMMHKILSQVSALQEKLDASPAFAPSKSKGKTCSSVPVGAPSSFTLTPSKKSLGPFRADALKAAVKIIFQRVALHTPNVALQEVVGAIALAINLTAPTAAGSISGAFVAQMKKALNQLLREAKSDIVGWIIDTFMMVHSATMPPRVPKVHVEVFEARQKIHELEFSKMLAAPGGYDLANYPHMHAFHAKITDVGVRTCS
jgi:hypothetical protein